MINLLKEFSSLKHPEFTQIGVIKMYPEKSEEFVRISLKISKELLDHFSEHAKSQGYKRRDQAIIDLIKKELGKKNL